MKPWIKRIVLGFAGITLVVGGLTACGVSRHHGMGSMSDADATVVLDNICKIYAGRRVVSDLSYTLHPGQVVALVGHNGAGKTTQIKMMLGLTRPDGGRLSVLGADPGHGRGGRGNRAFDAQQPAQAQPRRYRKNLPGSLLTVEIGHGARSKA